jgi:hypothetical protein
LTKVISIPTERMNLRKGAHRMFITRGLTSRFEIVDWTQSSRSMI